VDPEGTPLFLVAKENERDFFAFPNYFRYQLGDNSGGRYLPVLALLNDNVPSGEEKELAGLGNYSSVTMGPRISLFTQALVKVAQAIQAGSDANETVIAHGNDHMTAAATYLLQQQGMRTVFTVHNPAYRTGIPAAMAELLGIDQTYLPAVPRNGETQPLIDALELAFRHAGMITTVSPAYAKEIFTWDFGRKGTEGPLYYGEMLQDRRERGQAVGILNALQTRFLSPVAKQDAPNIQFLLANRLAEQKGWDGILDGAAVALDLCQVQPQFEMRVIADGDPLIAKALKQAAQGRNNLLLSDYSEDALLAAFSRGRQVSLMPSVFEPGGVFAEASQAKGSLVLANPVGGLKDILGEPLRHDDPIARMVAGSGPALQAREFGLAFTDLKSRGVFWQGVFQTAHMMSNPEARRALDSLVTAAAVRAQAQYAPGNVADKYLSQVYEPLLRGNS
jgi:glycogen synthase